MAQPVPQFIPETALLARVEDTLVRNGFSPPVAAPIAATIVACERDGTPSHGLLRLPGYIEAVRRARDSILANISHEFRTPLAAQQASIELLRDGLADMPREKLEELVKAEIVEREADFQLFQRAEGGLDAPSVAHKHAFCDLEFEPRRVDAVVRERAGDNRRQVGIGELQRRDIDRTAQIVGPAGHVRAGGQQGPLPEAVDQSCILGNRDEARGRKRATARMIPAHQRLEADDGLARDIDNRLVIELQFAALDRIAQMLLKLGPLLGCGVQAVLVEAEHPAPRILGGIERQIDISDQHAAEGPVLRCAGDAD